MHPKRCVRNAGFILAFLFAISAAPPAGADVTLTDIGTINGRASAGIGLNHAGDVAGLSFFTGTIGVANGTPGEPFLTHAILYSGGVLHDLGAIEGNPTCSPLGCQSEAFGVNDQDWVVGWTDNGSSGTLAYLWLPAAVPGGSAGFNVLPALSPTAGSAAVAVNNAGQMVGFSKLPNFFPRAALWQLGPTGATLTDLGTLHPAQAGNAIADDINDLGQVVGSASDGNLVPQAFLYLPSPAYGLPAGMNNLTASLGQGIAEAACVNNHGEVAGVIDATQPFVWLPSPAYGLQAGLTVLALERNLLGFIPSAISEGGLIVGEAFVQTNPGTGEYTRTPAAWRNGGWIYLNDLLPSRGEWEILTAQDVTHSGQTTLITGVGLRSGVTDINGQTPAIHGYLLSVTCPADLNDDGVVDPKDLAILRDRLGQSVPPGTGGDLNGDGVVDQQDLTLLTAKFGEACLPGTLVASAEPAAPGSGTAAAAPAPDSRFDGASTARGIRSYPGYNLEHRLRASDLAGALTPGAGSESQGLAATSSPGGNPLAPAPGLAAWPRPYRGGSLNVTLSAGAGVGTDADVAIFDLTGRRIRTLSPSAGSLPRSLTWDGRDGNGVPVGNGVYFLRATGAGRTTQLKIAVAR